MARSEGRADSTRRNHRPSDPESPFSEVAFTNRRRLRPERPWREGGRALYTLRNKRTIAHIGVVDPNSYDLCFLLHGSQWVIAELLRVAAKISMAEAGRLIEQ